LGGWRFTNVTAGAGVACAGQFSTGATFADIDGDGDLDLLVNGIGVGTRLFLNDGHGVFSEMVNSGLSRRYGATTSTLADIDGDGAPDLYVCNDFHSPDRIWLNDGHGKFRAIPPLALRNTTTFSMAVDVADLNRDGLDDIFVADMLSLRHSRRMMQLAATDPYLSRIGVFADRPQFDRNTLQLNRDDGTYAEVAYYAGLEATEWTWSV